MIEFQENDEGEVDDKPTHDQMSMLTSFFIVARATGGSALKNRHYFDFIIR